MSRQEPARLYRADPRESILQNDIVIRISVTTAILLAFTIFHSMFPISTANIRILIKGGNPIWL